MTVTRNRSKSRLLLPFFQIQIQWELIMREGNLDYQSVIPGGQQPGPFVTCAVLQILFGLFFLDLPRILTFFLLNKKKSIRLSIFFNHLFSREKKERRNTVIMKQNEKKILEFSSLYLNVYLFQNKKTMRTNVPIFFYKKKTNK